MASRTQALQEIFHSWKARLAVGVPIAASAYQFCCDQFDWPKLPALWGMTAVLIPWWGWLLIAQAGFVYALFEYVRRQLPSTPPSDAFGFAAYDDTQLRIETEKLAVTVRAVIDDYQTVLGRLATLDESIGGIRTDVADMRSDLDKAETARNVDRDKVRGSLYAIHAREMLAEMSKSIRQDAKDLYERIEKGETYDPIAWERWENVHGHWWSSISQWWNLARWYLANSREVLLAADNRYREDWGVQDSQLPGSEPIRIFKKFRIIQSQWEAAQKELETNLSLVAFSGLTELEVRHGQPPEQ